MKLSLPQKSRATALALVVALLTAGCVATAERSLDETRNLDGLRGDALALVNQARRERGLPGLQPIASLNAAAQAHAEDMARRDYYRHRSPEGQDVLDRYRANGGTEWYIVGENIAHCLSCPTPPGTDQVRYFQRDWMESPGHRGNILNERFSGFGFGIAVAEGKTYAVQAFLGTRN